MAHQPNRVFLNEFFDQWTIVAVWSKATIVPGYNQNEFRKDRCGAWLKFADYGNVNSDFGWEIDHEKPVAKGGSDDLNNLQPLCIGATTGARATTGRIGHVLIEQDNRLVCAAVVLADDGAGGCSLVILVCHWLKVKLT